jgi:hypothetical protein
MQHAHAFQASDDARAGDASTDTLPTVTADYPTFHASLPDVARRFVEQQVRDARGGAIAGTVWYALEQVTGQPRAWLEGYVGWVDGQLGTGHAADELEDARPVLSPADQLRAVLDELGYQEKPRGSKEHGVHATEGELDCGGPITDALADLAGAIFRDIDAELGAAAIVRVSGGNDVAHGTGDCHRDGRALDFCVIPATQEIRDAVVAILARHLPDLQGDWDNDKRGFLDEYTHPSGGATAGHFHIQVEATGGH